VLTLSVRSEGDGVAVVLENPGPFSGPRPGSDGVPTLERRLALAYGTRAHVKLEALPGPRTRATLTFPLS
jgi:two-component system, LytTR family, sensor histidine kinase AlgZ